jgi:probable phosphoglycerate mutase
MMGKITRLCLVRHGQTDWNVERRIQGQTDVPLNATGVAQAEALASVLAQGYPRPQVVYSSDLQRARATAERLAAALDLPVQTLPALRERHFGFFEGLTGAEAKARYPEAHARYSAREMDFDLQGGETLHRFAARVMTGLRPTLLQHASATVLAVSHGGVLDLLYRVATGRTLAAPRDFTIPNCAPNWFRFARAGEAERWILDGWGDFPDAERLDENLA